MKSALISTAWMSFNTPINIVAKHDWNALYFDQQSTKQLVE